MFENLKLRWFLIVSVLIFSIWFIYPTYSYYSSNIVNKKELSELQKESINLGLDLRGGLHIVLELDEKSFLQNLALLKGNKSQTDYESLLNEAAEKSAATSDATFDHCIFFNPPPLFSLNISSSADASVSDSVLSPITPD